MPLRANPQARSNEPRDSRAGGVCKQPCVYAQHPESTAHVFRTWHRWLSAVGIAGRVWPGHCCARGSEDAAAGCTIEIQEVVSGKHVTVFFSEQKNLACVYESEKRWEGVQWDASGRPALGEGEDPVNMEDANIGLGKRVEVCLED